VLVALPCTLHYTRYCGCHRPPPHAPIGSLPKQTPRHDTCNARRSMNLQNLNFDYVEPPRECCPSTFAPAPTPNLGCPHRTSSLTYTRLTCSPSSYEPIPHPGKSFHLNQTARHLSLPWPNRRRRTCFTRTSISIPSAIPHAQRRELVLVFSLTFFPGNLRPSAALRTSCRTVRHGKPNRTALAALAAATVHPRTVARDC
jgi:hypothetical protein